MLKWCTTACIAIPRPRKASFFPTLEGFFFFFLNGFCHLVWSKTVVSPSVYTSLQWRKNETHIVSMAPSLGISQGCKSILKQSNLRGVFFTFSFCNTWIIKKDYYVKKQTLGNNQYGGVPYPSQVHFLENWRYCQAWPLPTPQSLLTTKKSL